MDSWFRSLDKQEIMLDIVDEIPHADARKVFDHLDVQILRKLSRNIDLDIPNEMGMEL